jgi:hypothetical protein
MPSFEDEIWGSPAPNSPVPPAAIDYALGPGCRTSDHDRAACPGCSRDPRVQGARQTHVEQTQASITMTTLPANQPAASVPVPVPAAVPVAASSEPEGDLVKLARQAESTARALDREEKLLVAAEARVESLRDSVGKLKKTAELTRLTLADFVTKFDQGPA